MHESNIICIYTILSGKTFNRLNNCSKISAGSQNTAFRIFYNLETGGRKRSTIYISKSKLQIIYGTGSTFCRKGIRMNCYRVAYNIISICSFSGLSCFRLGIEFAITHVCGVEGDIINIFSGTGICTACAIKFFRSGCIGSYCIIICIWPDFK